MTYGKHTERFFKLILDTTSPTVAFDEKEEEELSGVILNMILDIDGPKRLQRKHPERTLFIANKVFKPFSEIMNTLEAIENIYIYIRRFPYSKQGVSRLSYLKYHIESYLNEIYMLKNRLIAYLNIIEKAYRKTKQYEIVKNAIEPLYPMVNDSLKGPVLTRGRHVHQYRYSDDEIDRLSTLELLSKSNDSLGMVMDNLFFSSYKRIRQKWLGKMKLNMELLHNILDRYFEGLLSAISEKGQIILPDNKNWS